MATPTLSGIKVALLVAEGFEQIELTGPRQALDQAGAQTRLVSPAQGEVQSWKHFEKSDRFAVDVPLAEAHAHEFDALVLPGGVANPDQLRMNPQAIEFVRAFFQAGKPVAVICHGPWTLIDAGVVKGRELTSWPSLKSDLVNAGAHWVDKEVVVDDNLVSSRKPADLPAFNRQMLAVFSQGKKAPQAGLATPASSRAQRAH